MFDLKGRLQEEVKRAEQAARVLEEPMLNDAFTLIESHLVARLKSEGDRAAQQRLTDQLQALESVTKCLRRTVETGKLALSTLKEKGWW